MPMRQLRACDFCGDEAEGVYEVIPPELSPTEAEQRRLALCESCVGTLELTLEPLLSRLGVDGADDEPDGNAEPARSEPASTSQTESTEPESRADRDSPDELDADLSGDRRSLPSNDSESAAGDVDDAVSTAETMTADTADQLKDGTGSISGPTDEITRDTGASTRDATAPAESEDAPADAPSTTDAAIDDEPEDFRTVMRLLGNREFPVDRAEIVELAESAYELDEAHIERILAYAVDRGLIVDDGTTLRKP
jgi:hypothetical protein